MTAERIVLDWIRDVAPVAVKLYLMPQHVKPLIEAIDAHLAEERAQMLTWSTQAIENHERAEAAEALALELADALERIVSLSPGVIHGWSVSARHIARSALSDERLTKLREKKNG